MYPVIYHRDISLPSLLAIACRLRRARLLPRVIITLCIQRDPSTCVCPVTEVCSSHSTGLLLTFPAGMPYSCDCQPSIKVPSVLTQMVRFVPMHEGSSREEVSS